MAAKESSLLSGQPDECEYPIVEELLPFWFESNNKTS